MSFLMFIAGNIMVVLACGTTPGRLVLTSCGLVAINLAHDMRAGDAADTRFRKYQR